MKEVWIFVICLIGLCHGVSEARVCTTRGRFPNENSPDCRGYTMCLSGAPGIFIHYDIFCPGNFLYSHIENQCTNVTTYHCLPEYNCTSEGNFVNEDSQDCSSYVACVKGLSNIAPARLVKCPEDMLFSDIEGVCVNSTQFVCVRENTSEVPHILTSQESDSSSAINVCSFVLLVCLIFSIVM